MKKLCLLFFSMSCILFAQEVKNITLSDTTQSEIKLNYFSPSEIKYELVDVNKYLISDIDILKIRSRSFNGNINEEDKFKIESGNNILNPLYKQYLQDQKYAVWKTILGSMQLGAVGYLAYKHIKKYGFK